MGEVACMCIVASDIKYETRIMEVGTSSLDQWLIQGESPASTSRQLQ